MTADSKHAIVYGASGLIGWALVNELLSSYPQRGTFSNVTAVTNRPLDLDKSHWPKEASSRPTLQLVSGINLQSGDGASLAASLQDSVKDLDTVTHIFYLAFTALDDDIEEVATNLKMLRNVIDAHTTLSPNLEFVTFPGGTRGYGIYVPGGTFTPPLTEDMVDKIPQEYAKTVVYPANRKLLNAACKGKKWTWCEVCPDAIVGFTPNGSQFSLTLHWAQYLSLYAYNHGVNARSHPAEKPAVEVAFPGNAAGATSLFTPVSSRTIARFMIYASFHPDTCGGGRLFNIGDNEMPCKFGELWTHLANWFGLVGVGPAESSPPQAKALEAGELPEKTNSMTPGEYITHHKDIFSKNGLTSAAAGGVSAGHQQLDSVGYWLTFDRQLSLTKLRETEFESDIDPVQGWLNSFEMFRKAGLIF